MLKYQEYEITPDLYEQEKDFNLEKTYEMCVNELGLQQTKRDQIIAFYIAVISFVIPAIIDMDQNHFAKTAGFLALYIMGTMMAKVVVRYRVYKEVYWITCRTLSQLNNFIESKISKDLVQHLFYTTLQKNMSTVITLKKEPITNQEIRSKKDVWKTYKKIQNSAETIIYEVLILLTSLVLWIGIFFLCDKIQFPYTILTYIIPSIFAILSYIWANMFYYKRLTSVYQAMFADNEKDINDGFNTVYSKAWFLHGFYQ